MDTAHGESATGNRVLNDTRNGCLDAQSWNMIRPPTPRRLPELLGGRSHLPLAAWRDGDQCSLWEIYQSGLYFSFRNVKTGLWLNLWMNRTVDGTKLIGYHFDGTNAMKWKLEAVSTVPSNDAHYAAYKGVNYPAPFGLPPATRPYRWPPSSGFPPVLSPPGKAGAESVTP